MKKLLVIAALGLLGACTSSSNVNSIISQAQQVAVATCGFLPTAETIAAIVSAGDPSLKVPDAIAKAICLAVAALPKPAAQRARAMAAPPPMVGGVVVTGAFVK
jgi:hypothetical protein